MIADTTLLVDLLRGDKKAKERVAEIEGSGQPLWIPSPALFELWEGVERTNRPQAERQRLAELFAAYTIMDFAADHAREAGVLSGQLVRRGEMIDPVDAQIAGMALTNRDALVTRNVNHYRRVPGLDVHTY